VARIFPSLSVTIFRPTQRAGEIATLAITPLLLSAAGVLPCDDAQRCSELPSVVKVPDITTNRCHERASHSTGGRFSHRQTLCVHTFGQWFSLGLASTFDCGHNQGSELCVSPQP
jgi:hypothetical protein